MWVLVLTELIQAAPILMVVLWSSMPYVSGPAFTPVRCAVNLTFWCAGQYLAVR